MRLAFVIVRALLVFGGMLYGFLRYQPPTLPRRASRRIAGRAPN